MKILNSVRITVVAIAIYLVGTTGFLTSAEATEGTITFSRAAISSRESTNLAGWAKIYGGPREDFSWSMQQTRDGGFVLTGCTSSTDTPDCESEEGENPEDSDLLVLKLGRNGEIKWKKVLGGDDIERGYFIQQTRDGGFVLTGLTHSFISQREDILVIKLTHNGKITWASVFDTGLIDFGDTILQTSDQGFLVTGTQIRQRAGMNQQEIPAQSKALLMKLREDGQPEWVKTFGKFLENSAGKLYGDTQEQKTSPTSDGGFVLVGFTDVFGKTEQGKRDILVVKFNANTDIEWAFTYGGPGDDQGQYITQTSDGGFILTAITTSFVPPENDYDGLILRLNPDGTIKWGRTFGGKQADAAGQIQETDNGRAFVMVGRTTLNRSGGYDGLMLKLNAEDGDPLWQKVFRGKERKMDWLRHVEPIKKGGFTVAGTTNSFQRDWDILVMKLDADGGIKDCLYLQDDDNLEVPGVTLDPPQDITSALRDTVVTTTVTTRTVTTEIDERPDDPVGKPKPICGER